ncbi:MAG: hypothetical protein OHK0052_04690 [Anaerolineales bacterium]
MQKITPMKKEPLSSLAAVAFFVLLSLLWRATADAPPTAQPIGYSSDTARARVLEILETGTLDFGGQATQQPYQRARVEILQGSYRAQKLTIDYALRQNADSLRLQVGQEILVTVSARPEGGTAAYFTDFVRSPALLWLFLTFVGFSLLISGWKGVRSLASMGISFVVILGFIIPQILAGRDPLWVSIAGSFFLLAVTLYLVYGWTLKTHAAALGTLLALCITGALAVLFVNLARLSGFGDENALFLAQQLNFNLNLRGLLLGGMLIGALGVLDDLVITQASVTFEIHAANPGLPFTALYQRAMHVGRDHVAATVNTLVLAYAGAALPLFLLFSLSGQNPVNLLNLEFVSEEVVSTLVGSLGLMTAVPITTLLASALARGHHRLGKWARYLGPEGESHTH